MAPAPRRLRRPPPRLPRPTRRGTKGREQVRSSLPLPDGITGIVTSPIPRARQTAALIAHVTGLPIIAMSGLLAERRVSSVVLGRTPATYPPAYHAWRERRLANPSLRFEDGESLTDLHARASHCVNFLHRNTQKHGPLLAVSHKLLLGVLTRLPEGPTAFTTAASTSWQFTEHRLFTTHQLTPQFPRAQP
ncbi:histidine phosphatase family protein [Streptomyces sp. P1-3]|uniref:histidine phosphatase family protein n=1 Tax=Streptomyces sp. P1-3 TaxID=3421658 RepID=UPI003D36ED88